MTIHDISEVLYKDLLNYTAVDGWFAINPIYFIIGELLRGKAAAVKQVYRKTRGTKRKQLDSDVYKPSVRLLETDSVEALKSEVEICQNEIEEWRKR